MHVCLCKHVVCADVYCQDSVVIHQRLVAVLLCRQDSVVGHQRSVAVSLCVVRTLWSGISAQWLCRSGSLFSFRYQYRFIYMYFLEFAVQYNHMPALVMERSINIVQDDVCLFDYMHTVWNCEKI